VFGVRICEHTGQHDVTRARLHVKQKLHISLLKSQKTQKRQNHKMGMGLLFGRIIRRFTPVAAFTASSLLLFNVAPARAAFVRSLLYLKPSSIATTTTRIMSTSTRTAGIIPGRPTWHQTMLRIKDPSKSLPFYTDLLGFTLIDKFDFVDMTFSLYFLTTIPEGEKYELTPGTKAAHDYLWSMEGVALELTHNHGTEKDDFAGYHPGNQELDGFGHIAINVEDVYATSEKLEQAGCSFKKKPDEGKQKMVVVLSIIIHTLFRVCNIICVACYAISYRSHEGLGICLRSRWLLCRNCQAQPWKNTQ
jgi:lactoylglutathione lyase